MKVQPSLGLGKEGFCLIVLADIRGCEVGPVELAVAGLDCLIGTLLEQQLHYLL